MKAVAKDQAKTKRLTRRFIVTEGLFETLGDSSDLPRLIELKERYKFRLILDETWSFGVLGRTGRGLTEAQNVDPQQVDMIIGSLAGPLCAGGGFCAGAKEVVEHQRITSTAYTYSAALPAMLAVTASETVSLLQSNPDILTQSRENIKAMRAQLDPRSDWVMCTSMPENPILLLTLKPTVVSARKLTLEDQDRILLDCVEEVSILEYHHFDQWLTRLIDTREWCLDYSSEDATLQPRHQTQRHQPRGHACPEGLHYNSPFEEGHREGRHHDTPCYYQSPDTEAEHQAFVVSLSVSRLPDSCCTGVGSEP